MGTDHTAHTGSPAPGRSRTANVQSVDRALEVLEILARNGEGGVSDIAVTLGVHKSTVSRLISVLERRGFVEQVTDRGKYRLGLTLVHLADATVSTADLGRQSRDICQPLAEQVGETVHLAVLEGGRATVVTEATGRSRTTTRTWLGKSAPAHATSGGKVLLAGLGREELDSVLDGALEQLTSRTIADPDRMRAELAAVRRRGWAVSQQELEEGLTAVAVPVHGHDGGVVAALSVSGPSSRLDTERVDDLIGHTTDAADRISARLRRTLRSTDTDPRLRRSG